MMMKTKRGTNVRQQSSEDGVLRPRGVATATSRLVSENRSILECTEVRGGGGGGRAGRSRSGALLNVHIKRQRTCRSVPDLRRFIPTQSCRNHPAELDRDLISVQLRPCRGSHTALPPVVPPPRCTLSLFASTSPPRSQVCRRQTFQIARQI